jgi:uncharacterized protein
MPSTTQSNFGSTPHHPTALRNETLLFWAAMAVLALHATVDAFVAPEPGTGAGDHVLRGSASLIVIAAAAAAYPRLRPGGRAALAGVLGVLALEAAVLAIADARAVGVRGEDWTGFVLGPAGLMLCCLAVALLGSSRKPGRARWPRRLGLAALAAVVVYVLVVPVAMALLATHRPRAAVEPADLGRPYRTVAVTTTDGLRLAGWYVPSRNGAAIVSYPTRIGQLPVARMLVHHGYGVLLLDARGYDGSEGDSNMFGWGETKDIDAAVTWLRRRPDVRNGRVGGIGFSVGGEMMLQAAAQNRRLRVVVSEGAGTRSIREELLYGARSLPALPSQAVLTTALAILSGTRPPPSLNELVPHIAPRPVFFISAQHGVESEDLNITFYRAANQPKQIWNVPDARHTGGHAAHPRQYEQRVTDFFDHALLG